MHQLSLCKLSLSNVSFVTCIHFLKFVGLILSLKGAICKSYHCTKNEEIFNGKPDFCAVYGETGPIL